MKALACRVKHYGAGSKDQAESWLAAQMEATKYKEMTEGAAEACTAAFKDDGETVAKYMPKASSCYASL